MNAQFGQSANLFVYGTLQRGEERAHFWPRPPLRVEPAFILARLYDLGPYPAIVEGEERIRGELWMLAPDDVTVTLEVLDRVEGYNQGDADWYVRRAITCWTFDGRQHPAFAYFWGGRSDISAMPLVPHNAEGFCDWKQSRLVPPHHPSTTP